MAGFGAHVVGGEGTANDVRALLARSLHGSRR